MAADKNEILWGRYGINYNDEKEIFRRGSVVFREVGRKLDSFDGMSALNCSPVTASMSPKSHQQG